MSLLRPLYLVAAAVAVVLAFTAPYWLPTELLNRKIRKHFTPSHGGSFPFYWASNTHESPAASTDSAVAAPASSSESSSSSSGGAGAPVPKGAEDDINKFPFALGECKVFTKVELSQYDGSKDPSKPLLLVVLGEVYDVTSGERFYAPGNGYNGFVGKDNSAAFQTGKFNTTVEDVRGLGAAGVKAVVGWRSFFRSHATYKFRGVLKGLYFTKQCQPTAALQAVHAMAGNAQAGEEEDKRRAKLYPRCNMHYDGILKQSTVWCDGYETDADVKAKAAADKDLRVLRMVKFVSQASGEQQQDCRCLRLHNGEAALGSVPFPTATVEYYFPEKGCAKDSPRCFMVNP